jgi:hypothetical protein
MYEAEIWGSEVRWIETDVIQGRLCKKVLVLRTPRSTVNGVAKLVIGRDSRGGYCVWL